MIRPFRLAVLAAAALAAAGCQKEAGPAPEASATAPDAKPGLSLSGGRLVLPAVKGNPGAVYFALTNGSAKPVTIAAFDVAGAGMAMLHETKEIAAHSTMMDMASPKLKPGETLTLSPAAAHVMVDRIPAGLIPGGTVELTIVFADGDKLSAPLAIEAPGGAN